MDIEVGPVGSIGLCEDDRPVGQAPPLVKFNPPSRLKAKPFSVPTSTSPECAQSLDGVTEMIMDSDRRKVVGERGEGVAVIEALEQAETARVQLMRTRKWRDQRGKRQRGDAKSRWSRAANSSFPRRYFSILPSGWFRAK